MKAEAKATLCTYGYVLGMQQASLVNFLAGLPRLTIRPAAFTADWCSLAPLGRRRRSSRREQLAPPVCRLASRP